MISYINLTCLDKKCTDVKKISSDVKRTSCGFDCDFKMYIKHLCVKKPYKSSHIFYEHSMVYSDTKIKFLIFNFLKHLRNSISLVIVRISSAG